MVSIIFQEYLSYDEKNVNKILDEILEKFTNKETHIPILNYEVNEKTYEIPTVISNNKKYILNDDEIEELEKRRYYIEEI